MCLTNRNRAAQQIGITAGDVNELTGLCQSDNFRRVNGEREDVAAQCLIVPNGADFLYGHGTNLL